MPDMLVKLYELPDKAPAMAMMKRQGILVRRALPPEMHVVVEWVKKHFSHMWASECAVAIAGKPSSCIIAQEGDRLVGFGCYEATCRNFFGPTGVLEEYRGRGIGKALLLECLHGMAALGYAYAIIGCVGPAEFYEKAVGATMIEGSSPGVYRGLLRE